MAFIVIFISFILEKSFDALHMYRHFDWFNRYADWVQARSGVSQTNGAIGVLLILVPLLVLVALISVVLEGHLFGLLTLAFSIVVLFMSFGPRDLGQEVDAFLQAWSAKDDTEARVAAGKMLGDITPADNPTLIEAMSDEIFIQANERIIAVVFWFILLGPLGAALYRLTSLLRARAADTEADEIADAANRLHDILAWVPARLCAFGFAVTGSFVDVLHNWREKSSEWANDWQASINGTLIASGRAALQTQYLEEMDEDGNLDREAVSHHIKSAVALVWRTMVMWMVVIALVTLSVWAA